MSKLVKLITQQYQIRHRTSSPYHPQANEQVDSTNTVIEAILTKTIQSSHTDWEDRLPKALWAYRTSWRTTTGYTPYKLLYEKQVLLAIEFQLKTFRMATKLGLDLS